MDYQVKTLIAEDNFMVGEMIQSAAEDAGCVVVGRAFDGRQAVEMTTELRPDVILMDIKMPNLDGIEAAKIIQDRCPTPVVILTAYDTPEMLEGANAAGVGAFLAKPPNVLELRKAIVVARGRFGDLLSLHRANDLLRKRTRELEEALTRIKTLRGLIPICAYCKKIRSDKGYWQRLEEYITEHSEADFTHGICFECLKKVETEMEMKANVDGTEPGVLPAEGKASHPPENPNPVDCADDRAEGIKKKRG